MGIVARWDEAESDWVRAHAALSRLARQRAAADAEEGRWLTVCAACSNAGQQAGGELVPVGAEVLATADCDAQHLGQLLPLAANENATGARAESSGGAQLRSEHGRNEPSNLVTLCGAHHRATHRGQLLIELMSDGSVRVRHADGTTYGRVVRPEAVDAQTKVFSALRQLGFREREVRAVLEELRREARLLAASTEGLLREALRRIRLVPR